MQEYNFIQNTMRDFADIHLRTVKIKLVGIEVERINPVTHTVTMKWDGIGKLVNRDVAAFKYPRAKVNSRWPWPFRLKTYPTVVVEGMELYTTSDLLMFRVRNEGLSSYLRPGDTLRFDEGSIKIDL